MVLCKGQKSTTTNYKRSWRPAFLIEGSDQLNDVWSRLICHIAVQVDPFGSYNHLDISWQNSTFSNMHINQVMSETCDGLSSLRQSAMAVTMIWAWYSIWMLSFGCSPAKAFCFSSHAMSNLGQCVLSEHDVPSWTLAVELKLQDYSSTSAVSIDWHVSVE